MNVVTGVFDTVHNAEDAVRALMNAQFSDDDIGVATSDRNKGSTLADDLGRDYAAGSPASRETVTSRSDVYARLPDGFIDTIRRAQMPDDAVDWYRGHLDQGHILVIVRAGDRMDDAGRILREHHGVLYGGRGTTEMPQREAMAGEGMVYRMPVVDEEVLVEKTQHQIGEVMITPERTSETVEVPMTVTHEEIRVERRRLDRLMTPDEYKGTRLEEGMIRIPIVEEEVRVVKRPVVREEFVVTRVPVSEQKTVRETVTHAEPHVETTGEAHIETVEKPEERKRRPAA